MKHRACGYRGSSSCRLLKIAAKDLGEVRTQLSAWRVVRDGVFRRDERAVWLPHWRRGYRQPFHDGVCVAELLIAIRCRLLEPDGEDPRWLMRARVRWHLRRAIRITSFIAGDPAHINAVLTDPHSQWWATSAAKGALGPPPGNGHGTGCADCRGSGAPRPGKPPITRPACTRRLADSGAEGMCTGSGPAGSGASGHRQPAARGGQSPFGA